MRVAGAGVKVVQQQGVKAVQQQLGHQAATVTLNTYTHLFDGDLDEVVDRLDVLFLTKTRPERVLSASWALS